MASRARGGARGQSTALPSRSRAPSAAEVRSRYVRQLDDTIDKMIESFKNVILSAQIHDRATNARGEFLAQVSTANLAMASESLVRLISELKLALIVQDVGEASEDERSSMTALSADTRRALDDLCRLRDNIAANLSALERHYYASVPHVRAHQAANANLQPQPPHESYVASSAMALTHLFARCPVLPVDVEISLARYLASAEETRATAASVESTNPERSALLHIRVVQLVAKTLPAHPDRTLLSSPPILAKLEAIAHDSLNSVERLARSLESPRSVTALPVLSEVVPPALVVDARELLIPAPLLDVFSSMVRDRSLRGERSVGVLAARIVDANDVVRVSALVVPAQRAEGGVVGPDDAIRHDSDVRDLATHKSLSLVGVVVLAPGANAPSLLGGEQRAAMRIAAPSAAIAIVATPGSSERVSIFEVATDGNTASRASRARLVAEAEPAFKLYDLRSLAAARDAQAAQVAQHSRGAPSPQDV